MISLITDFYFEVFQQLKHVLSYFTGVYSHWILLELTAISIASLVQKKKKTYLAVSLFYQQWVDFFVNLLADR